MYNDAPQSQLIRRAFKLNAVLSLLTGLVLVALPGFLGRWIGFEMPLLYIAIGIVVLVFAADVWWVATRPSVRSDWGRIIFALDVAWVIASVVVLAAFASVFTAIGVALIGGTATVVAGFALAEFVGLKRLVKVSS
ncbi:MAG: hypothetical protein QF754_15915 [Alphaproteobacteria bacterium]|nr:hypothetical protein [Alphaproteobacteria bacterium]|tara:strand:- start:116 stop:523 length:408 start_codon:yes stop_codon:yes gene_type:complete